MTENNNIPEPREGKKLRYRKRVYKFLSNKFSDFKRNESDFYNELDSNPEYASKVYDVIYDNFGDFKKGKDEFVGLMTISKKKEPSTVASRVGGQAGISEVPLGKDKGLGEVTTPKRGFIGPEEYELPKPEEAKAPEEVKITEEVKIPELKVPEVKLPETQLQQQVAEEKPKRTSRIVLEQKDISPFLSFGPSFPLTDRPLPEGSRTIYNFKDNPDAIASESQKYGVKPESLSQVLKDVSADSDDNKIIEAAKVYQYAPSLYKKTIASASWAASIRNGLLQEVKEGEISKEDADNIYNIAAKGKNFSYDPVSKQYVDLNYDEAKSRVLGNAELIKRTVKNTEEQKKALEDLKTDQAGFVLYRYGTSPENQQKWKSINGDLLVGAGLDVLKMTEPEKASEIEKVFSNPDSTLAQKVPYFNDLRNIGYSALQSEVIEKINARNYYDPQQEDPTTSKALDNLYKWYNYLDKKAKEDYSEKYGTQIQEEAKTLEEKAKQERANAPILNKAFRGFSDIASGLSRGAAGTFVNTVDGFATLIKNANLFVPGADPTKLTNFLAKKYEGNIDELFPQTPEFKNSIADQLSQALGQVAAMVLAARAGGGGGRAAAGLGEAIPQTVVKAGATTQAAVSAAAKQLVSGLSNPASVVGALNVGQQEYRRAKEAGASDEQAFEAFVKNGVGGSVLEQIPVMKFFERLNKATSGGVLNYIKTKAVGGITGGIEEMTTEVLQQLYANKTAKDIYNINQDLFEGVTSSGGIGFGAGFILNAMGQRANILRKEGKVKEAQSIEDTVGKIEQRLNIDAQKERDDLAKQGVVLEKAEVTPTAPKEETLTDQVARQIEEQEKAAQAVGEVAPEAAPQVPAAKIPKEIQDLYLKRATLRTTVDALKMQMGGKELAGKAKAEYEKTLSELNSIEAQISEYEQSQSIKKEPVKEQKIETLRKEEGKEPATTSNDYANYLLDLIQQKQQNLGWKDAPELREGLAKAFEQTLKERGENRAISELETTYVQYIPEGVRADAYQTIRKNYEKQKPEVPAAPEITDAEYRQFIDKGVVSPERLNDVAQKVKKQEKLSEKEQEIFTDKTADINKIIAGEVVTEAKPELPAAKIENPKVVITGTRNGLENLSSNNYDIKTDAKIQDARGREDQFENGVLIEDDGKGNTIINIKTDAVDSFGRRGFLQASVIVPKGKEVNPERIKSVVEAEVKKLRNQYNTLELGQVQQADLVKLKDAVVRELQGVGEEVAAPQVPAAPVEALKDVESTAKALEGVDVSDLGEMIGIKKIGKISESEDFETATKNILGKPNYGITGMMMGKETEISKKENAHTHTYPKSGKTLNWDLSVFENNKGQKRYVLYERKYPDQIDAAALIDKDGKVLQITTGKDFRKIGLAQTLLKNIKDDVGEIIPSEPISKAGKKSLDNFAKLSISEAYHKAKADGSNPELVKAVEDLLVGEEVAAPQVPAAPRISKERAAQLREQIKVEEVGEEAAPQVPAAPEKEISEEITEEAPTEEELKVSKEINIKEDEIPRVKKASAKRSRKSKDIANTIESEAADVESSGDAERAADVVTTIERAEKAILEDKPVDTKFEDKYGVPEIELAREYDSRQGKVDIFTIYESLSGKKIERGAEAEFISSFLNALNSEGFKLKKPLELDFGVVVNTTSSPAKKLKKEGFDSLEKIVGKDDIRPIFQSVFFDKGNLVATDAHTLVVIKQKESDSDIIKNAKEKLIKSYSKTVGEKEATRFANEKYAPLEKSGLEGKLINQKTGEIKDGKFPDYQAIIPQDFPLTQSLPIQDIIDLANGAIEGLKSASKTRMAIMFNVTGDTEVTLGINPSFLLKTLQALQANGAKSIKMGFGGPTKAITIRADNGDMGLVMPLMINEDDLKINITDAKPLTVKKSKVGDAVRKFAEKAREGKINKPGTARASTGFDAVWDAALEVVATSLEAGASVADAIEAGLKYVKSTGWYKKVKNREEFDQQFKDVLNQEYAVQVEAAGEVPVQPKAGVSEEVEAGVPPTRPPKTPEEGKVEGEEKRLSGIKKGLVSQEILGSVNFEKTGDKELLEKGRQIIESGEVNPKSLVDKIVDEGRGVLSPAEVVALIYYKADLDTKVEDLTSEMERMKAAGEDLGEMGVQLKDLEVQQRNFDIAAVITAQQQSMSFRLRRWMLDRTYSLQQRINNYKKVNNGTIPENVQKKFEELDKELQSLKKQIRDAEIRKADEDAQVAVDNIVEDVNREDARQQLTEMEIEQRVQKGVEAEINRIYEQLPAKKKSRAEQAIAALDRIQARLRNKTYDAGLGIPVAFIDAGITTIKRALKAGIAIEKAVQLGIDTIKEKLKGKPFDNENVLRQDLLDGFKAEGIKTEKEISETLSVNEDGSLNIPESFLRDLVRSGKTSIEQLTDAVFKELEPQLPGLTKRQIRDSITQYGKTINPTKDDVRSQLGAAKRIGRLLSEVEDLKNMSPRAFFLKYGKNKSKNIPEKERLLKEEVRNLMRSIKADPSLIPLKDAENLSRAKENAKRRIQELQDKLKKGDYSKKPKPTVKADAELEILNTKKEKLQEQFEEETKLAEVRNRTFGEKAKDFIIELLSSLPRSLVAGFDLSAPLVQAVWRIFTSPIMSARAFAESLRQFASPKRSEQFMNRYRSTYDYVIARNSKLAITSPEAKISENEQFFVLRYANLIYDTIANIVANIVTLGYKPAKPAANFLKAINPLKASQRAFEGYINYIRISTFKKMSDRLRNDGYNPEYNPEVFKSAADFVNTTTGRASLGALETSSKWLGTVFFAARKVAAELKLFTPYAFFYYAKMPATIRKRALMDFAKFATSVLATHVALRAALEALGEEQEDDFWNPKSPNFMSFKIGEKRLSVLGGAKSTIVFMSRLLFGNTFVDKYGEETKFGERAGKKINTKFDLITRFVAGKFAPVAAAFRDYMDRNPNYENDDEIYKSLVTPIWIQDLSELYKDDPIAVTGMFNLLSIVGANITKVDFSEVQDQITFTEKIPGGFTKITVGKDTVYKKGRSSEVKRIVKLTDAQKEEFQNLTDERFKVEMDKIAKLVKEAPNLSTRAKYTKIASQKAKEYAQKILEEKYKDQFRQFPIKEKVEDKSEEVKKALEEQKKKKTIIF